MEEFWFCFVPLFVAMDAIGLLPIYLNLTEGMSRIEQRRTLRQSVLTLGLTGVRTVSKITGVILAAFGVMMVRKGCLGILEDVLQSIG
jgi:multiple antibiotic resistance protein